MKEGRSKPWIFHLEAEEEIVTPRQHEITFYFWAAKFAASPEAFLPVTKQNHSVEKVKKCCPSTS